LHFLYLHFFGSVVDLLQTATNQSLPSRECGGVDVSNDDITYGSLCRHPTLLGIDVGLPAGRGLGPARPCEGAIPLLALCDGDGVSIDACISAVSPIPDA
jgi:hypothetical protein